MEGRMCDLTDKNCSLCREICMDMKRNDNKICKKICGDDEKCQTLCNDDEKCHKLCENDGMRIKLEKACEDGLKMELTDCLCKNGECKKNCKFLR